MSTEIHTDAHLWTLKEVADRLKICERSVHNLLNSGELEGMLIKRRWKFAEAAIQVYVKAQTRKEGQKGARKKRAYTKRSTELGAE